MKGFNPKDPTYQSRKLTSTTVKNGRKAFTGKKRELKESQKLGFKEEHLCLYI